MKHSAIHKIFSVIMTLLVLFSTVSFTVESHYCGDFLIDSAIFTNVKKCGADNAVKVKPCCKDEVEVIKGQDELQFKTIDNLEFSSQLFFTAFVYSYDVLLERLPKQIIPHRDYIPPNIVKDIQLLDDIFLI